MFDLGQDWDGSGVSLQTHLQKSFEATGVMPSRLDIPPIPHAFERSLRIWQDLHCHRSTGLGLGTITWPDIAAYCQVTGDRVTRGEIDAVRVIDSEFHASRQDAEDRRGKAKDKGAR